MLTLHLKNITSVKRFHYKIQESKYLLNVYCDIMNFQQYPTHRLCTTVSSCSRPLSADVWQQLFRIPALLTRICSCVYIVTYSMAFADQLLLKQSSQLYILGHVKRRLVIKLIILQCYLLISRSTNGFIPTNQQLL